MATIKNGNFVGNGSIVPGASSGYQTPSNLVPVLDQQMQIFANKNPEQANLAMDAYGYSKVPSYSPAAPISSAVLAPQAPIRLPQYPQGDNPFTTNASIPTPQQIVTASPTNAENSQNEYLKKIAELTGAGSSLATFQSQQEQAAGIPGLAKTLNDIGAQIMGLNDQAAALQNEAQYTIPNAAQISAEGRGITTGGLAPITASQLRLNQIKQGAIAIQTLTLKSAYYAAQGNYALAKDAADKAAQVQFDAQEREIAYKKAQLDAIAPTLNKEEKQRAAIQQAQLDDRKRLLDDAKLEKQNVNQVMITAAKYGADSATLQKIAQSNSYDEAIISAGSSLVDPKAKYELESAKLENTLRQMQINKLSYETGLLKKYGGMTPSQYSDYLKEQKKAINETKDASSKSYQQGIALQEKIDVIDAALNSPALKTAVGTNFLSRSPSTFLGSAGAFIFGGAPSVLGGALNTATGATQDFISSTEQLISKEFLQNLIDVKAQGATFGALTEKEQQALTDAATKIGRWRVKNSSGDVTGYNIDEDNFRREMNRIKALATKAYQKATGEVWAPDEQKMWDDLENSMSGVSFNPAY